MAIETKSTIDSFNYLVDKLNEQKKLYYIRFGDGEITVMMGNNHRNYNFSDELKEELISSFKINDPNYLIGLAVNYPNESWMSEGVFKPFRSNYHMENFLDAKELTGNKKIFENFIFFHYLSVFKPKLVYSFFEKCIRPKKKMFIGSTAKNVAEKLYGEISHYIKVPSKSAYDSIDDWWPKVIESVDDVELVIPSAGAASNVISKRLWELNKEVHLLDIGSIIDAVDNKVSRTWIRLKGHKIQKVLPPEYREVSFKTRVVNVTKDLKYFFRVLIK